MPALRLNGVFGDVVTEAANGGFSELLRGECTGVSFAFEDEIRVASHLPHAGEQAEDVRVV